jgi:hypothetical protein
MNKKNVVYKHDGLLLSHEKENYIICSEMDGTGAHHVK